jgi:CubicO group peptidase (beta-lactamase class C family)
MVLSLQTTQRVDEIVARTQAQTRAPSLVAAVVRDGAVAHVAGAGETPRPDSDTQYRIGSITKSLTAAVVLQLRDEGRLDLDDRLDAHLPGTGAGEVRLRQLLGHVGGMQREPDGLWWERHAGVPLDELVKGVGPDKLAFRPYQRYHYSNLAYGLLGGVIERTTGESWWDEVSRRLLGPLGMVRTTYHAAEPFAVGYVVHPWHGTLREEPRHDSGAMAPAGQLWSTAADLARWATVLATPAEPGRYPTAKRETPVLAPATVAEMACPVAIADPDGWTSGYGLGLQLWRRGERVGVGHSGSMPGYLAMLLVHRRSGTSVIAYANTYSMLPNGIGGLGASIMEAVLDGEPPTPAPVWRSGTPPPPDVAPLCGRWWWMGREYESTWDADRAQLVIHAVRSGALVGRFAREADDRWRGRDGDNAGEILLVHRDGGGVPTALDIATFVFTREELPAG